jgi:hypothetical protein
LESEERPVTRVTPAIFPTPGSGPDVENRIIADVAPAILSSFIILVIAHFYQRNNNTQNPERNVSMNVSALCEQRASVNCAVFMIARPKKEKFCFNGWNLSSFQGL